MTTQEMIDEIRSYEKLEEDWDSYGAEPINKKTIELGCYMAAVLPPGEWKVYPQHDGEIWFEKDDKINIGKITTSIISVWEIDDLDV
jgi:hypothetical protein